MYSPDVVLALSTIPRFIPLPKSSQAHRVKSNMDVFDFNISEDDMAALDALDQGDVGAIAGWNPPINVP